MDDGRGHGGKGVDGTGTSSKAAQRYTETPSNRCSFGFGHGQESDMRRGRMSPWGEGMILELGKGGGKKGSCGLKDVGNVDVERKQEKRDQERVAY